MILFYIGMTVLIVCMFGLIAWIDHEETGRWPWEK